MSSMLRQHHVKIQDLVGYLRGFDPSKSLSAEDWSKLESAAFEPGMVIFCLERVTAPQGLAFGKRDDTNDTYRVRDLCIVVGHDNNRPLVVNITASAFELRFLEVLLQEKARKAILDGKDFVYVAAQPSQPLSDTKIRDIEQLGAVYAQGGSRRALFADGAGPQEPASALLAALGVKLTGTGLGKQVLDIGSICHMLFSSESRQDDRNKALIKQAFTPLSHIARPQTESSHGNETASAAPPAAMPQAPEPAAEQKPEVLWQPPIPATTPGQAGHSYDLYTSPPAGAATATTDAEPDRFEGPNLKFSFERTEISTDSSSWQQQQSGQGYSFPAQAAQPEQPSGQGAATLANTPALNAVPARTETRDAQQATEPLQNETAEASSAWSETPGSSNALSNFDWHPEPSSSFAGEQEPTQGWSAGSEADLNAPQSSLTEASSAWNLSIESATAGSDTPAGPGGTSEIKTEGGSYGTPQTAGAPATEPPSVPNQHLSLFERLNLQFAKSFQEDEPVQSPANLPSSTATGRSPEQPFAILPGGQWQAAPAPTQPAQQLQGWSAQGSERPAPAEAASERAPAYEFGLGAPSGSFFAQANLAAEPTSAEPSPLAPSMLPGDPGSLDEAMAALSAVAGSPVPILPDLSASEAPAKREEAPTDQPAAAAAEQSIYAAPQPASEPAQPLLQSTLEEASPAAVQEAALKPTSVLDSSSPPSQTSAFEIIDSAANFTPVGTEPTSSPSVALELESSAPLPPQPAVAPAPEEPPVPEAPLAVTSRQGAPVQNNVFQEPKLVMSEMTTLMTRLEQQVGKAGKKLNARAEEIKQRLNAAVARVVSEAAEVERNGQNGITELTGRMAQRLDDVSEEVRQKISDTAATGRYTIKQQLQANQSEVEDKKTELYESLKDVCSKFRVDTDTLTRVGQDRLNELVNLRTAELETLVNEFTAQLNETNDGFSDRLNSRFERFRDRMREEAASVVRSLERNVRSMTEEIDGSWDRASDKLKSSKSEFELTINHTVRTSQLHISSTTRRILSETLIPKLREHKATLRTSANELGRRFAVESDRQANSQLLGLESSLSAARQQLQTLVEECISNIDTVGRAQQAGLEEIFKETSTYAEKATAEAIASLQKAELTVKETEHACKSLAESSSLEGDSDLVEEKNNAATRIQLVRKTATSELSSTIESSCSKLEQLSQQVQTELSNGRLENTQSVRDTAENGLTRLREAIQEALSAIQGARDKYME